MHTTCSMKRTRTDAARQWRCKADVLPRAHGRACLTRLVQRYQADRRVIRERRGEADVAEKDWGCSRGGFTSGLEGFPRLPRDGAVHSASPQLC